MRTGRGVTGVRLGDDAVLDAQALEAACGE